MTLRPARQRADDAFMIMVRRLTESDWRTYRDLLLECLRLAPYAARLTYDQAVQRTELQWQAKLTESVLFGAWLDDVPVGLAGGKLDGELPELVSMWVDPVARGKGTADELVRAVLDWARDGGYGQVMLWVLDGNEPAERVYLRNGFRRTGRREAMERDAAMVEVEMVLDLGSTGQGSKSQAAQQM
ncbi:MULTISPECIES: GNAT family N-acetyltransferase [unclassified Nocardia]|uniref:GNAT family N-acetyltransferase n=1 Tax=unclassified Nocardia TaxID=2637762 RepID=UPI001CE43232|nr:MULTISPECIES: GNAT family N-acetyltransferase [unclassified Nocardia]